ncbi:hypothetical protein [Chitinophaga sp. 212800010-3]|uniref:GNAT family N-acetyltransferase n=1 Tax=unclassified Chitinophaga TaxID=2619133 RepID=UPI002DE61F7B|nr:hypothetical protein [Chitinophaga sp. 212800010-3]
MRILYQSDTIVVREFRPDELQLFMSLFEDEQVTRYLPARTLAQYTALFNDALKDYCTGVLGRWAIFDTASDDFIAIALP